MSLNNDFKLLNQKCIKYYELLDKEFDLVEPPSKNAGKARLGFYLYVIENVCGLKDISEQVEVVTDLDFNNRVFGKGEDDWGVDAVHIDYEANAINLFNFKYREKFSARNGQKVSETLLSTKFVSVICNNSVSLLRGKVKDKAKEIIDCLEQDTIWDFNLYVVSNEVVPLSTDDAHLTVLKDNYDLKIVPIALPEISEMMSLRPKPICSQLVLDEQAIMSYEEHQLSSSKSYIARLKLSEVVRITCNDAVLRNKYNIEDVAVLSKAGLDFGVLYDNVRGFVERSKYNPNITVSIQEEPEKFFMYNNGLTIVSKDIKARPINAAKKIILELDDFQVLNGGQTLRTVHNLNCTDETAIYDSLSKGEVLVRILNSSDEESINKIAEYTNSQNSISNVDLKSLSAEQISLEQYLDEFDIVYARKLGDTGISPSKDYKYKIGMERFGQILCSSKGYPERASGQKKKIFSEYYKDVFVDSFDMVDAPSLISSYFEIKKEYAKKKKSEGVSSIDLKHYYTLYILYKGVDLPVGEIIDFLESAISSYEPSSELSIPRQMLKVDFKNYLNSLLEKEFDLVKE